MMIYIFVKMAEKYDLMSLRTMIAIITPGNQSKDRRRESWMGGLSKGWSVIKPRDGRVMDMDEWI